MASRPMNDEEVLNEMNKMVAFIKQEADEKARELKIKADEEFAIEKAKIVRQESLAIDANFEKKRKQADTALKIAQSTSTNKSRLRVLQTREQLLQDLFGEARGKISELSANEGQYAQLLESLITESMLRILEPEVTIFARKKDADLVKTAADGAAKQYTEISGREVKTNVEASLSDDIPGGIKVISGTKRITVDNTLDERLRLLEDRMLPEIRHDLFGPNENRKFYT
ncbi:ATPase V1/A1 complex subunit E [Clavulina sp. PMI_390]|nr:ATPase V1/A1 complex subunit E [Clavulina sp. PMI_390]